MQSWFKKGNRRTLLIISSLWTLSIFGTKELIYVAIFAYPLISGTFGFISHMQFEGTPSTKLLWSLGVLFTTSIFCAFVGAELFIIFDYSEDNREWIYGITLFHFILFVIGVGIRDISYRVQLYKRTKNS